MWDKKTIASHTQGKSANSPEVYTTQYQYDTFGRLMVLTLPDGEVLTHSYDAGGNLASITGVEGAQGANTGTGGVTTNYLQTLLYDKFEQRTYLKLGNGVETHYTYRSDNRRLMNLMSSGQVAGTFQNLNYGYDSVGNILGLQNKVAIPAASSMGGPTSQTFGYDDLYRLTSAKGTYQYAPGKTRNYTLAMGYDDIHNIVGKNQADAITEGGGKPVTQKATTYDWSYVYDPAGHPHAPVHIGNRTFSYDLNGNQTGWTNDNNGTRRTLLWDEENRISQIDDNGERNYYTYDAAGERTIKVTRQGQTVYINQYYVVRNRSIVSKHIFAGSSRIATHMEMGNGNTGAYRGNGGNGGGGSGGNGGGQGTHSNSGNAYAYGEDQQHGQSGEAHGNSQNNGNGHGSQGNGNLNSLSHQGEGGAAEGSPRSGGAPTGVPLAGEGGTSHGNAQGHGGNTTTVSSDGAEVSLPGNSDAGLENALSNGQGHKYGIYKHLEREGDTASNGEITPSTVAGATTVNGQSSFLYYYHPDHLGSTGFVTDGNGKLYEHMEYFPFGESWVDEHSNTLRTPYLFTGKEFDQETGLYYFGARYYDPRTSVWQSADLVLGSYLGGERHGGVFKPIHLSLYTYVLNRPVSLQDPDGNAEANWKPTAGDIAWTLVKQPIIGYDDAMDTETVRFGCAKSGECVSAEKNVDLFEIAFNLATGKIAAKGGGMGAALLSDMIRPEPTVTATARVGGKTYVDFNQEAKLHKQRNDKSPTAIADVVAERNAKMAAKGKKRLTPNGTMNDSHAEIGAIQQAINDKATVGADMELTVEGHQGYEEGVCSYCTGDIPKMAERAGLRSLVIHDKMQGETYYWKQGQKRLERAPKME